MFKLYQRFGEYTSQDDPWIISSPFQTMGERFWAEIFYFDIDLLLVDTEIKMLRLDDLKFTFDSFELIGIYDSFDECKNSMREINELIS